MRINILNDKKKKFKPMMCPVCDGMYFSGPAKADYENELNEYLNGEVICVKDGKIELCKAYEEMPIMIGFKLLI